MCDDLVVSRIWARFLQGERLNCACMYVTFFACKCATLSNCLLAVISTTILVSALYIPLGFDDMGFHSIKISRSLTNKEHKYGNFVRSSLPSIVRLFREFNSFQYLDVEGGMGFGKLAFSKVPLGGLVWPSVHASSWTRVHS
jgi:hypothetical protein